jgi:hypothetical protein
MSGESAVPSGTVTLSVAKIIALDTMSHAFSTAPAAGADVAEALAEAGALLVLPDGDADVEHPARPAESARIEASARALRELERVGIDLLRVMCNERECQLTPWRPGAQ